MARDLPRNPRHVPGDRAAEGTAPAGRGRLRDLIGLALLAGFLGVAFHDAFQLPFLNDDYTFLERTRDASFASLWGFQRLAFQWYRPWSRDLHFWWLQRWFGPDEAVFHLANLVLGLACLILFAILARRIAGARASAWAVAAAAALSP